MKITLQAALGAILCFAPPVLAGQSAERKAGECRCGPDSNGACQLEPLIPPRSKESRRFLPIRMEKSKDKAYALTESTRFSDEDVEIAITQGGCGHVFTTFQFTLNERRSLTNLRIHLNRLAVLLEKTRLPAAQDVAKTVVTGAAKFKRSEESEDSDDEFPYICDSVENAASGFTCLFRGMDESMGYLEIKAKRTKSGKVVMAATEILAL